MSKNTRIHVDHNLYFEVPVAQILFISIIVLLVLVFVGKIGAIWLIIPPVLAVVLGIWKSSLSEIDIDITFQTTRAKKEDED